LVDLVDIVYKLFVRVGLVICRVDPLELANVLLLELFLLLNSLGLSACSFLDSQFDFFAGHNPLLAGFLLHPNDLIFSLFVDVHEGEGVPDVVELDEMVKGRIRGEAGSVVDFENGWFCFVVDHDVETQQLEAHVCSVVFRLAGAVGVAEMGQTRNHGLDDAVLDLGLQLDSIHSVGLEHIVDGSERSFVTLGHVFFGLVEHEFRVVLIDSVIGKVHANVLHVLPCRRLVLLSGEST
jgi:hypothetical protein